ncbi:MAG: protelomerase family protein [Cyanobacteria bacterium P01_F01_bin.42]
MSDNRDTITQKFRDRIAAGQRNKLSKQEFNFLIESFIQSLECAQSSRDIHELCRSEIALLEEGYQKLTLASIYIPRYRAAIKAAIADQRLTLNAKTSHEYEYQQRVTGKREHRSEHWALTYFKYTPEEYEQLDQRQAQVNQTRLSSLKTVELDRYLEAIDQLLHSQEKFTARHQAIAIAALTGRRMGEVVARGNFQVTDHPYRLHFTGQQKYERDGYDILTLIPAADLLQKIGEFRARPEIQKFWNLETQVLKVQLNKFDVQLNKECNKALNETQIVPPLEGKKSVTIHNLRGLWGAIACHFFCPEEQHEYAFLQHYLGHVLKSSATGHYFRYQLVDSSGQRIKAKGVKLNDIQALESAADTAEQLDFQVLSPPIEPPEVRVPRASEPLLADVTALEQTWRQHWAQLEQRLASIEESLSTLDPSRKASKINTLNQENKRLKTENARLSQQLNQAESKLEQFRQLLLTDTTPNPPKSATKKDRDVQQRESISTPKAGRKPGKAFERARSIFNGIQQWNHQNPDRTFAVNPSFLESVFHINRKAAQQFCDAFESDLIKHHRDIGIERITTHNRGKNPEDMITFVRQKI